MTVKPRYTGTDVKLKTAKFSPNFKRYLRRYHAEYIEPNVASDLDALKEMGAGFIEAGKHVRKVGRKNKTSKKTARVPKSPAERFTKKSVDAFRPADEFMSHLFEETSSIIDAANRLSIRLTKKEIVREVEDIRYFMEGACERLKNLSDDVDRKIVNGPFLVDMLTDMEGFIDEIKRVEQEAKKLKRIPRSEASRNLLVELAIVVLRTLKEYGISASQTANEDLNSISPAMQILVKFADELGLNRSPQTMLDIVGDAKKKAPDLQS